MDNKIPQSESYRLGVDIGGTFTDFVLLDESKGSIESRKIPTTPDQPADAVLDGVKGLTTGEVDTADIGYFVHGTTLALNTLIERTGSQVGLLTTSGFEDVLELRRLRLPEPQNFYTEIPTPLVRRQDVRGIDERIGASGEVINPVDLNQARRATAELVDQGCSALAICFLHSYASEDHEKRVKEYLEAEFPDLYISTSAEVWPQRREYERSLLTTINAHVGRRMRQYFSHLEAELRNLEMEGPILSTKSNGGVMTAESAGQQPVETLFSGPASGVIGAHWMAEQSGFSEIITFDMGGTSADVSVVSGDPTYSTDAKAGDFPIMMPSIDVTAIGAGGGSIAWVDQQGVLKVGPQSAGADPGPACYGRGGGDPTITDAYLALGWLNADRFAGGDVTLDPKLAENALATLGEELDMDVMEVAWAILQVATTNMHSQFTPLLASRGVDASEYGIVAYGGAGPTHAFHLAKEVGISNVIVPEVPGALSALGCLVADLRADFVQTFRNELVELDAEAIEAGFEDLERDARAWLDEEGISVEDYRLVRTAEMRYVGQSFEITTPIPDRPISDLARVKESFFTAYEQIYSFADREATIEVTDLRVQIVGVTPKPQAMNANDTAPANVSQHNVSADDRREIWRDDGWTEVNIFDRAGLSAGAHIDGPAVIEQDDTTVVVPEEFEVRVDRQANLIGEVTE